MLYNCECTYSGHGENDIIQQILHFGIVNKKSLDLQNIS